MKINMIAIHPFLNKELPVREIRLDRDGNIIAIDHFEEDMIVACECCHVERKVSTSWGIVENIKNIEII